MKFGGTSVGSPESIKKVISIIKSKSEKEKNIIGVFSAFSGVTDSLVKLLQQCTSKDNDYHTLLHSIENRHLDAIKQLVPISQQSEVISLVKDILNELEDFCKGVYLIGSSIPKIQDIMLGFGERLSSLIIYHSIKSEKLDVDYLDSRKVIKTDENFGNTKVLYKPTQEAVNKYITRKTQTLIMPGFIASTVKGDTTTLGRGGSDFSASILAYMTNANACEIWTDVSGVYSSDPRLVKNAIPINRISYEEAMELSHFGAKVIYAPTIQPVKDKNIPTFIKNTFSPDDFGTIINDISENDELTVKGITSISNICLINVMGSGMVGTPGYSNRIFNTLYQNKINIVLLTQCSSEYSITIAIHEDDLEKVKEVLKEEFKNDIKNHRINEIEIEKNLSVIAIVGDKMNHKTGICGKSFSALGSGGVNVRAIAQGSSERNISIVINEKHRKKAVNLLHETFFKQSTKQLHLFIAGVGNIGQELINQIIHHQQSLIDTEKISLKVIGISNSKKMHLEYEGVDISNVSETIEKGEPYETTKMLKYLEEFNLSNTIFVDATASELVSSLYEKILQLGVSIATANKIALSGGQVSYNKLKQLSDGRTAKMLYETNVGAALPIITTLKNLKMSGDEILKIEAVLSGSLNFIFSQLDENTYLSKLSAIAREKGFTEPNPLIDLSGGDVAKKSIILAREIGLEKEIGNIVKTPVIEFEDLSDWNDIEKVLKSKDEEILQLVKKSAANKEKLRYTAKIDSHEIKVGIDSISESHPFYRLEGTDNMVLIYTKRYGEKPLVIQGAGAGKEVTASGLLNDILQMAEKY